MNPGSKSFLVITVVILIGAVLCLAQGQTGGGIVCAAIGLIGLLLHVKAKKKG
ncbi:MAG: hypothetical protein IJU28_11270 [Clostridia bacterium]|nr:hypothetical protein [Clostridia bacterium]